MIDSSGTRALRADGTVFDLVPVGRVVGTVAVLLVALFVLVRPEASHGLDAPGRTLFWALHVGIGLLALKVASVVLVEWHRLPEAVWAAVLATGLAGIAIAAPACLALDAAFAAHVVDLDPEPAPASLPAALFVEAFELAPWFLATWALVNLPLLLPRPERERTVRLDDAVQRGQGSGDDRADDAAGSIGGALAPRPTLVDAAARAPAPAAPEAPARRFLATLPGIVGTDVVAVASDLHYLNVWTVAGRTTVLGNLRDVVADLGDVGMQVHRSHWVAHAHVRRIVGTSADAACLMSNELRVPVSRRRWKAVREQYGRGIVHAPGVDRSTAGR